MLKKLNSYIKMIFEDIDKNQEYELNEDDIWKDDKIILCSIIAPMAVSGAAAFNWLINKKEEN